MLNHSTEMKTVDSFMCAIDGEGWSENSAPELSYLIANAATFAKLEDVVHGLPNLKLVDCGDKVVGVLVLTMDKQ